MTHKIHRMSPANHLLAFHVVSVCVCVVAALDDGA